ncbi:MFS transporter [Bacillus carboniphilus]|uniref:MFS transporter n=1 Tax=Bacillus carboniphilus TaxID=86663 RepID=A0ABY9JSJ6_9BACI|nr:MFS transporter [Bacillus carboniphilus]WLR41708.1 MFS transporter [Bacillus carboniphilus]
MRTQLKKEESNKTSKTKWKEFFEVKVLPISIASGLLYIIYGGIVSFISLYAQEKGNVDLSGYFLGIMSIALILSRPISGKIADRLNSLYVVYPGFIFSFMGVLFLGLTESALTFQISALLIGLGFGFILPSLHATMLELVPNEKRGTATSTYFMGIDIGISSGAIILGLIANYIGYGLMYLSSVVFIFLSCIVYFKVEHQKKMVQKSSLEV